MDVCCTLGFPKILQSDNGTEFVNGLIREIKQHAGFEHRLITPYHPQANGTAERWVGMAVKTIIKRCNGVRRDWDLYVM
jgi:transposase InsO family protein